MKKALKKILLSALSIALVAICSLGLIACDDGASSWDKTEVANFYGANKSFGTLDPVSNGGFVAETDKYVYFINGVGVSTDSNTFGEPVKGSLMVANKTDLSKSCVVVPKLFVASDYNAGLYIKGEYVYYGTPSTDKKPDGNVASEELVIARAKLDGSDTKTYLTVGEIAKEYRFVEINGNVCVVYYDDDNTALVYYDTATDKTTTIAKTTVEEAESLDTYKFTANGSLVYTLKVYKDAFNQAKYDELGDAYTRNVYDYNKVCVWKNGTTTEIMDGKATAEKVLDDKYTLSAVNGNYVFYTYGSDVTKTAVIDVTIADATKSNLGLVNATYATAETIIFTENGTLKVYAKSTDAKKLLKDDLLKTTADVKDYVANVETVSKLLSVKDGYVYYINSTNQLARIWIGDVTDKTDADLMEQRLTENTVATDWYKPEFVGNKLLYVDNSEKGLSYVNYVDLTAEVQTEKDDDGEVTLRYIDASKTMGKITDVDGAAIFGTKITDLTAEMTKINYDKDEDDKVILTNGKPTFEKAKAEVKAVRDAYNALSDKVKESVDETLLQTLENYEYAIEISEKLTTIYEFDTSENKDSLKTAFEALEPVIAEYKASENYTAVEAMIEGNLKYYFQEADKYFNPEVDGQE